MDFENAREEFPQLKTEVNGGRLVYLDSAATSLKPESVIKRISEYYRNHNSNIRGVHSLAAEVGGKLSDARRNIADFIGAEASEIIFTSGTTDSMNILSEMLSKSVSDGEILVPYSEHHANYLPWRRLCERNGADLVEIGKDENFEKLIGSVEKHLSPSTRMVVVGHVSNVTGLEHEVGRICERLPDDVLTVVDAAQSAPHMSIDVKEMKCDFLAFSGHKMLGPMGTGVLYGRKELLEETVPPHVGGGAVKQVGDDVVYRDVPRRFEPGTPNIAGILGISEAVDYLEDIGMENVEEHSRGLAEKAFKMIDRMEGFETLSGSPGLGIVSFNLDGVHPHDLTEFLDRRGIEVRGGKHCAHPFFDNHGSDSSIRASFYIYNTEEDVEKLIESLEEARDYFL